MLSKPVNACDIPGTTDGLLGNKGIYDALTPVTAAVFNYMRSPNTPAVKVNEIFPWINEYSVHPDNDLTPSDGLLLFMSQAPGFSMERVKNVS